MSFPASKARLAVRLLGCQIAGTGLGILIGGVLSNLRAAPVGRPIYGSELADLEAVLFVAILAFGVPAYCVALLILHNATRIILKHMDTSKNAV